VSNNGGFWSAHRGSLLQPMRDGKRRTCPSEHGVRSFVQLPNTRMREPVMLKARRLDGSAVSRGRSGFIFLLKRADRTL
jgi:hypothetical protein